MHTTATATHGNSLEIPRAIRGSALMARGGYSVYADFPNAATFEALYAEAVQMYPRATHQECHEPDAEQIRGGKPRRKLLTAQAGAVQDAMYASEAIAGALSDACGIAVVPSGNRGSYSYYARAGDFLDLHRDIETCDVAMITALHDNSDPSDKAGALLLYPGRIGEPLSAIHARPTDGVAIVKLLPGQTILMFGGVVPHRLLPVREGHVRIISVLCFRALIDGH